jgi:hypothetical protein
MLQVACISIQFQDWGIHTTTTTTAAAPNYTAQQGE